MWKLGNLEIKGKVVLAPMAGITSNGYRHYLGSFGASIGYTEMVSDMGIIYDNAETLSYIEFPKEPFYTGLQLFGNNPQFISQAAQICLFKNPNIDFIDVNMGCPVPKVTKPGSGSAIMKNPKLAGDIIRALKSVTDKPITAKIRLGYDHINYLEVIKELEDAGVAAIALHGRTRKELYGGVPHYEMLENLRSQMSVPLIISGNIYSLDDAIKAVEITGADGVMVARGGMGNPYLVKQINHYFETGEKLENPSLEEQINYCLELGDCLIECMGENKAMRVYRGIAPRFFMGFANCKLFRSRLAMELTDRNSLIKILEDIKNQTNGF